jgi:hypothetical protein
MCTIGSVSAQCIDYGDYLHWVGSVYTPWYAEDVAIVGSHAYVAGGYSGLQVIDIADPQYPHIVYNLDNLRSAFNVSVSGNHAYVTDWDSLWVLDISNSEYPQIEGSLYIPGCRDVAISGNYAYVDNEYNIIIVNVANPVNPQIVSSINITNRINGIATTGTYIYVTSNNDVQVFDITDPASPLFVNSMNIAGNAIAISNIYAYITGYMSGLYVVNIADPSIPNIISYVDNGQTWDDIAVVGSRACVLNGNGIHVINILDPYRPQIMGSMGMPFEYRGVAISNNFAYIAGQYNMGMRTNGATLKNNYTMIPIMDSGLQVIDITNPVNNHIAMGGVDTPGYASCLAVTGTNAYVANYESGVQIIDITNQMSPQIVGNVDTPGYAHEIAILDTLALVACGTSLQIIDIKNCNSPQIVGSLEIGVNHSWDSVAVKDNYAYVADDMTGLYVIDITNTISPQIVNVVDTPGNAVDVTVSGNMAYVADGTNGLLLIDITNPSNPQSVGSLDTPGWADKVVVSGNYAYVADEYYLMVIDITNPGCPQIASRVQTQDRIVDAVVSGYHAIVAYSNQNPWGPDGANGLQVIDINNPQNPQIVGSVDTPDYPVRIAVMGEHIYVACGLSGLLVVPSQCETNVPNLLTTFTAFVDDSSPGMPYQPGMPGALPFLRRTVNLSWTLSEPIAPEALQLTASAGGAAWDVPFAPNPTNPGGWSYAARDEALQLASVLQARYTLLHAPSPGAWTALAERTVTFNPQGTPGVLAPTLDVYPNPFNPRTMISYDLPRPGEVSVAVYDLRGRVVRSLWRGALEVGRHQVEWDGRDERGDAAPTGIYLVRLITDEGVVRMQKMTLAR